MKIGILTFFRPINYGAFLQAYALSHRLNQEPDMDVEIIDFHMPSEDAYYERELKFRRNIPKVLYNRRRYKTFRDALKEQNLSATSCCASSLSEFESFVRGKYDIIIVGSDEVWKVDSYRGFPAAYFLPGDLGCKKVSYAASGRTSFEVLEKDEIELVKKSFHEFDYIGARDQKTVQNIEEAVGENSKVHLNFDPSFVYEFSPDLKRGQKLLKEYFHLSDQKKVIAVMTAESPRDNPNLGRYLKKNYGDKYDFISLYNRNMAYKNSPDITPLDWVDLVAAVDGVISMFYHGICFSIIAGVPFYTIDKRAHNNSESKLYDFLQRMDLLDYYSLSVEDAINQGKLSNFIDMVEKDEKIDCSSILNHARDDFNHFVNILREINANE